MASAFFAVVSLCHVPMEGLTFGMLLARGFARHGVSQAMIVFVLWWRQFLLSSGQQLNIWSIVVEEPTYAYKASPCLSYIGMNICQEKSSGCPILLIFLAPHPKNWWFQWFAR
eukprot:scaffold40_cov487-Pavlova_lutheri.AAC.1